jgi:hypothetical protein
MLDLMAFMYMADIEQTKEIGTRNPTQDFSEEADSLISWMIRCEERLDTMTQSTIIRHVSVVDFSVYNRDSGNIRCVFCPKAEDPERILNPLMNLFSRSPPLLPASAKGKERGTDDEHTKCYVVDSRATHPRHIRDAEERRKREEDEFAYFARTLVTCVERTQAQKEAGFDGWKMPIGAMGGALDLEDAKVSGAMISLSRVSEEGREKEEGEYLDQTTYFLASLPSDAWYATSTIPPGECMERVKALVRTFRVQANSDNRKRKTRFGAFKYGKTMVMETDDPNGVIKTIRGYFAAEAREGSGHNMVPWAIECKRMLTELCITKDNNKREKARTTEELEREQKQEHWRKKRRVSGGGGSALRPEDDGAPKEAPVTPDNKWDYYLVLLRGTDWCPVRERRVGDGRHSSKGRGYLRIYRTGKVECGCYSEACKADMKKVFGPNAYYWRLPHLTPKQRKILWAGV